MDMTTFASMIGTFNSIRDIGKLLIDVRDSAKRMELEAELNHRILEAQAAASSAFSQIDLLRQQSLSHEQRAIAAESELRKIKNFEAELEGYELHRTARGGITYRDKLRVKPPEGPVHLCANCAAECVKTFLQRHASGDFDCPRGHGRVPGDPRSTVATVV